jgi:hypothetical protein
MDILTYKCTHTYIYIYTHTHSRSGTDIANVGGRQYTHFLLPLHQRGVKNLLQWPVRICLYVYICVCVFPCLYICRYVCLFLDNACQASNTHTYTHTHTHIHTDMSKATCGMQPMRPPSPTRQPSLSSLFLGKECVCVCACCCGSIPYILT